MKNTTYIVMTGLLIGFTAAVQASDEKKVDVTFRNDLNTASELKCSICIKGDLKSLETLARKKLCIDDGCLISFNIKGKPVSANYNFENVEQPIIGYVVSPYTFF